jgi:rhodanese-related sulfurtransferase
MFAHEKVPTLATVDVAQKQSEGWMLLDVRTDHEWSHGRIPGSVHIPLDELVERLAEVDDRVICVCAVGARSARVTQFLVAQGKEAVNLEGGVHRWADEGRPLEA